MCNYERCKRGFTTNDRCPICLTEREDVEHVIRGCKAARKVWNRMIPTDNPTKDFSMDFNSWFDLNVAWKGSRRKNEHWNMIFAITVWWVWKWRNEVVFSQKTVDINQKIKWLKEKIVETNTAFEKARKRDGDRTSCRQHYYWKPPEQGWIKINTDGCSKPLTNAAACGAVLRDSQATFKGGVMCNLGRCTAV